MKCKGSCHCGKVAFEVEGEIDSALSCSACGIHPYGEGVDPKGNHVAAVNLRCIEGVDLTPIPVHAFNGRDL